MDDIVPCYGDQLKVLVCDKRPPARKYPNWRYTIHRRRMGTRRIAVLAVCARMASAAMLG